jgi:hypothetical protein
MVRFKDIMTKNLVYYDSEYKDHCTEFCKARNIQYLPEISNPSSCMKLGDKGSWQQFKIKPSQYVYPQDAIFRRGMDTLFKKHEVLFVRDVNNALLGVVHFSDYNRPIVYNEAYQALYKLERGLLHLIVRYGGQTRQDLLKYVMSNKRLAKKKIIKEYIRKESNASPDELKAFLQPNDFRKLNFTLIEFMDFVNEIRLLEFKPGPAWKITNLRNKVAHSEDLVQRDDYKDINNMAYDYKSFRDVFWGRLELEVAIKRVSNRFYFMTAHEKEETILLNFRFEDYL